MTETQLFYLTIMLALLVLYLIVSKICETKETIAHYDAAKHIQSKAVTRIDCNNAEELQKVIKEINNEINKEVDNKNFN